MIALLDDTALGNGIEALGVALGRGDAAATCPDRLQCTSADCCFERHKNYPCDAESNTLPIGPKGGTPLHHVLLRRQEKPLWRLDLIRRQPFG